MILELIIDDSACAKEFRESETDQVLTISYVWIWVLIFCICRLFCIYCPFFAYTSFTFCTSSTITCVTHSRGQFRMNPVFIGGCHRSGTTFLGALLGSHPACLTTPESQFKTKALEGIGIPQNSAELQTVLHRAFNMHSLQQWCLGDSKLQSVAATPGLDYAAFLRQLTDAYGACVDQSSYDLWVDHTPINIRYLKTLFSIFPEARAIHLIRDGRAVAGSVMPLDWGPNTIISAAHWWVHHMSFGLAAESCFGKNRVLRVHYEDLIKNPQAELEKICSWLNLEYVPEMSHGGGYKYAGGLFRYHKLVHGAPDSSRVSAWQKSLSERQIKTFESRTGELLSYLGYEILNPGAESATRDRLETALVEPLRIATNSLRFQYWRFKKNRNMAKSTSSTK